MTDHTAQVRRRIIAACTGLTLEQAGRLLAHVEERLAAGVDPDVVETAALCAISLATNPRSRRIQGDAGALEFTPGPAEETHEHNDD